MDKTISKKKILEAINVFTSRTYEEEQEFKKKLGLNTI